jgi:phage tail sheath protein FI
VPEYLAPGVYLEEVSYRSNSVEGVGTTTTGLIGPTRYGPWDRTPDVLTSLSDFEQVYGDGQPLDFQDAPNATPVTNFMWQAVRAFFMEGGQTLYVMRTWRPRSAALPQQLGVTPDPLEGHASYTIGPLDIAARWPGAYGELQVKLTLTLGQNVLSRNSDGTSRVNGLNNFDLVWIDRGGGGPQTPKSYSGEFYQAVQNPDLTWSFVSSDDPARPLSLASGSPPGFDPTSDLICPVALGLTVSQPLLPNSIPQSYTGLPLDPNHQTNNSPDSVFQQFINDPARPDADAMPIIVTQTNNGTLGGLALLNQLAAATSDLANLGTTNLNSSPIILGGPGSNVSTQFLLVNGDDGLQPTINEYVGEAPDDQDIKTGLAAFEDIDDISIVAAPGSTYGYSYARPDPSLDQQSIIDAVITHCEKMMYRIAVIDCGDKQQITDVLAMRSKIDSSWAAFYYPWVQIFDPISQLPLNLPPSGFVAGIYARNDINNAVYKAPANEIVNLAVGFEKFINKGQQEILNPQGVNCFRYFEGRGYRLWGARLATSDQEWKYVNLRRYFAYLEHSLDKASQFAVFESNGPKLWDQMRHLIEPFLLNEFINGAFVGATPALSYFVRCDATTMTQNDLDNGRLVVLVGVAVVRPAEFVIIRVGQWTASASS